MTGQLQTAGDGGPMLCALCGAEAAGPCARCKKLVCGDCCVLTEGSAKTWAICLVCERRGGKNLLTGWWIVLAWIALPIVGLAILVVLMTWLWP